MVASSMPEAQQAWARELPRELVNRWSILPRVLKDEQPFEVSVLKEEKKSGTQDACFLFLFFGGYFLCFCFSLTVHSSLKKKVF